MWLKNDVVQENLLWPNYWKTIVGQHEHMWMLQRNEMNFKLRVWDWMYFRMVSIQLIPYSGGVWYPQWDRDQCQLDDLIGKRLRLPKPTSQILMETYLQWGLVVHLDPHVIDQIGFGTRCGPHYWAHFHSKKKGGQSYRCMPSPNHYYLTSKAYIEG